MEAARRATTADLEHLVGLATRLRTELAEERGGPLWALREAVADPGARFAELLTDPHACVVVGTIDGIPVGYATAVIEPLRDGSRLGIIEECFTEPGARAVGVGEAMLDTVVGFCSAAGCGGIDATALPGHREAKNFFERAGFTARRLVMHQPLGPASGPGPGIGPG
ncbi:MAG: N-acetyltransferase family protein [Actinomycetota bacterium]